MTPYIYVRAGKALLRIVLAALLLVADGFAIGQQKYIQHSHTTADFAIVANNLTATLCVDSSDHAGVIRAVTDLQADIRRVTGSTAAITHDKDCAGKNVIIVGTIGKSGIIDRLVSEGKIDAAPISGKWESFFIQTVASPLPGVENALVIAGSDKRGAI